ncbi:hypothetical protein BJ742DRAFT_150023 [Cladochytrium replicatum]|nr:hypothetical protein BJ742DRAFT_150023 [Cladochytrium replicatum]
MCSRCQGPPAVMASECWENPLATECQALPRPYAVVVLTYTIVFLLPAVLRYARWRRAHLPKHSAAGYLPIADDEGRDIHFKEDFAARWETFDEDVDLRSRQASMTTRKFQPNLVIGAPLFITLGALLTLSVLSAPTGLMSFSFAISFLSASSLALPSISRSLLLFSNMISASGVACLWPLRSTSLYLFRFKLSYRLTRLWPRWLPLCRSVCSLSHPSTAFLCFNLENLS